MPTNNTWKINKDNKYYTINAEKRVYNPITQ